MTPVADVLIVETTVASRADADRIAGALVEGRLAACVQAMPVASTYRWDGAVRRDDEVLLRIKTVADRLPAVEAAILSLHDYAVPEIIVVPIGAGGASYLDWLRAESRDETIA